VRAKCYSVVFAFASPPCLRFSILGPQVVISILRVTDRILGGISPRPGRKCDRAELVGVRGLESQPAAIIELLEKVHLVAPFTARSYDRCRFN